MAKDKAAKQRQRDKERRIERQRALVQKTSQRRAVEAALSDQCSARSLGILSSVSPTLLLADAALPIVPAPPHFGEMLDVLRAGDDDQTIEDLAWHLLEHHDSNLGFPPGVLFTCNDDHFTHESLPSSLRFWVNEYHLLLLSKMKERGGSHAFSLSWEAVAGETFVPVVVGVCASGATAMWYLDLDGGWFPATSPEAIRLHVEDYRAIDSFEQTLAAHDPVLWFAFEKLGGLADATCWDHADERLAQALQVVCVIQGPVLDTALHLTFDFQSASAQVSRLLDEISVLESERADADKQVVRMTRALEENNRLLAVKQAASVASARAEPRARPPAMSVAARLAQIF